MKIGKEIYHGMYKALFPGEGNGNPLQHSCLENPTDRGTWQATVCGVARVRCDWAIKLLFSSVQSSVMSHSLRPHGLQHARPPCPLPTSGVDSNSCPLSRWCHTNISFSVIPFSFCLQSFPASQSFQMSQFIILGSQSIGVSASASVLPVDIQDWFSLGWTGWISLQSKGLSRVFSNTTVQKH